MRNALDAAQTVEHCVQHQKRIVDDVLTVSKLNSDLVTLSPVAVQPVSLVQKALRLFKNELKVADIYLLFEEDPSMQALQIDWLFFDPTRILQVLINLITNAIKFTRNRPARTITISLAASTKRPSETKNCIEYFPQQGIPAPSLAIDDADAVYMSLAVRDTSCGLSPKETEHLFHRFGQGSPKTAIQYGGSGLGLFISRQLVEIQGGGIGVSSTRGVGSTFMFFVETSRASPPLDLSLHADQSYDFNLEHMTDHPMRSHLADVPRTSEDDEPPPETTRTSSSSLHILIVEDNLVNQKVLRKQLVKRGYTVGVANHGGEALNLLQKTKSWNGTHELGHGRSFDVVLMDLEMPVMDGIECIKRVRQLEALGILIDHTPVIAVTANVRSEQLMAAKKAGMVSDTPILIPCFRRMISLGGDLNIPTSNFTITNLYTP